MRKADIGWIPIQNIWHYIDRDNRALCRTFFSLTSIQRGISERDAMPLGDMTPHHANCQVCVTVITDRNV